MHRGHSVTVVVTANGLDFAKRAAARHSSNTTAEAMQFVDFSMPSDGTVKDEIANLMKIGQHPGKYSSELIAAPPAAGAGCCHGAASCCLAPGDCTAD